MKSPRPHSLFPFTRIKYRSKIWPSIQELPDPQRHSFALSMIELRYTTTKGEIAISTYNNNISVYNSVDFCVIYSIPWRRYGAKCLKEIRNKTPTEPYLLVGSYSDIFINTFSKEEGKYLAHSVIEQSHRDWITGIIYLNTFNALITADSRDKIINVHRLDNLGAPSLLKTITNIEKEVLTLIKLNKREDVFLSGSPGKWMVWNSNDYTLCNRVIFKCSFFSTVVQVSETRICAETWAHCVLVIDALTWAIVKEVKSMVHVGASWIWMKRLNRWLWVDSSCTASFLDLEGGHEETVVLFNPLVREQRKMFTAWALITSRNCVWIAESESRFRMWKWNS